jgi:hypothetical protein
MKHIKLFEELDSTDLLQKKLQSKEAIKKMTKADLPPATTAPATSVLRKMRGYNPIKYTDAPLDVYLQRSKEGTENRPKESELSSSDAKEYRKSLTKFRKEEEEEIKKEESQKFIRRLNDKMMKLKEVEYLEDIDDSVCLFGNLNPFFNKDLSLDFKLIKKSLEKGRIGQEKYDEMMSHFYQGNKLKSRFDKYKKLFEKGYPKVDNNRVQLSERFYLEVGYPNGSKEYILYDYTTGWRRAVNSADFDLEGLDSIMKKKQHWWF